MTHRGSHVGRSEGTMSSIDPWQKADEFQKALKWIADPKLKAAFTEFRDLWIALANKKKFLTPVDLETEAEALNRTYSEWVSEGSRPLLTDRASSGNGPNGR